MTKDVYEAPEVVWLEVKVENGYLSSMIEAPSFEEEEWN